MRKKTKNMEANYSTIANSPASCNYAVHVIEIKASFNPESSRNIRSRKLQNKKNG